MIARKSFLIISSQFIIRFIGWVGLVILARGWKDFSSEALGVIGFTMAFLALFNIIADLGFGLAYAENKFGKGIEVLAANRDLKYFRWEFKEICEEFNINIKKEFPYIYWEYFEIQEEEKEEEDENNHQV